MTSKRGLKARERPAPDPNYNPLKGYRRVEMFTLYRYAGNFGSGYGSYFTEAEAQKVQDFISKLPQPDDKLKPIKWEIQKGDTLVNQDVALPAHAKILEVL